MNISNNLYLDNIYTLIKYQNYDKFYLQNNIINIYQSSYFSFYRYDQRYIQNVFIIIKKSLLHLLNLIQIKSKNIIFNSTSIEYHNFIEYKNNNIKLLEQSLIGLNNFIESMKYYNLPLTTKYLKLTKYINKKIIDLDENLSIQHKEQKLTDSILKDSKETIIYLKPIQQSDRFNISHQDNVIDIPPLIQVDNYSSSLNMYNNQNNQNNQNNYDSEGENICNYINLYCLNLYKHLKYLINI
tara:strand:+ start:1202 stop:1924 length:723 start_codon:yes stop_codon:yes gene_type:complete